MRAGRDSVQHYRPAFKVSCRSSSKCRMRRSCAAPADACRSVWEKATHSAMPKGHSSNVSSGAQGREAAPPSCAAKVRNVVLRGTVLLATKIMESRVPPAQFDEGPCLEVRPVRRRERWLPRAAEGYVRRPSGLRRHYPAHRADRRRRRRFAHGALQRADESEAAGHAAAARRGMSPSWVEGVPGCVPAKETLPRQQPAPGGHGRCHILQVHPSENVRWAQARSC